MTKLRTHFTFRVDTWTPDGRPEGEALRLREGDPLRYVPHAPASEETPSDPIPIMATLRAPDERDPAGVIARGYYRHTPSKVRVYDTDGNLLGNAALQPGDAVEAVARRVLREKKRSTAFYDPIAYPRSALH